MSRRSLAGLLAALRSAVRRLDWKPQGTPWADYYEGDSYSERSSQHKRELVARYLERIDPRAVLDLGANTGVYSRIASGRGIPTLACDVDPACVERNYREVRARRESKLLPLVLDLTNPSPAIGWANRERATLPERRPPETLMALALIHHIAIANNVPLPRIAAYFASLSKQLIIEFVAKNDPKVQTLLATREDIFPDYTREGFEEAFAEHWIIDEAAPIEASERTLYRMHRRSGAGSA